MAYNGTEYLVVWSDDRGTYDIYGGRVSTAGAVLSGTSGFVISNAANQQMAPSVVYDGAQYFVAWQDLRNGSSYDIYGSRVTKTGTVLDTTGILISAAANHQKSPAVAFDGSNYFVVWSDGRWGTSDIYGARVSTMGVVLDPAGIGVSSMTANAQTTPSVAFDGTNHVVVWADTRSGTSDIYAARVSPAGTLLDTTGFAIMAGAPAFPESPAVTCTAAGACFAVWQDKRNGNWDIYGARFSDTTITDPQGIRITIAANDESNPAVAFDGTNYLVVWQDKRAVSNWDIYGARVSGAGVVLDTAGIAISAAANDQITPRVTWMAPSYLVVWEDKRSGGTNPGDIYGARVDAAGAVLDASGFVVSAAANEQKTPSVAADGTNFFVVWADARSSSLPGYGARVSPAAAVLEAAGVSFSTGVVTSPAVAWDGTRYLVVWSAGSEIRGNRMTPAGAALDGTTGILISSSGSAPQVAFDGLNFLTVFSKGLGVSGARVSGAAAVLDPTGLPISPYVSDQPRDQPAVGCDGSTCLVAWRDYRSTSHHDIYGSFVDQSGTILNAGGIVISANTFEHAAPAVARDLTGHALVAYQRLDLVQPYGGLRVHARLVTSLGQGATCSAPSDCASGFCVDGVCCNTACGGGSTTDCFACSVAAGASANGSCTALDGIPCNDNNVCTATDVCQTGTCVGSGTVTCAAMDSCHTAGTCNVTTGMCTNPVKPDGSTCSDGNLCTKTDTCTAGACTGKNPVVCPTPDQCHTVAPCDPATGMCALTPKPDGTACTDNNACTMGDTCQAGACVPGALVVCPAPDQCHTQGTCNTTTGVCSNPQKANGAVCEDGNLCTKNDTCQAGVCKSGAAMVCPGADQCNDASTCDPSTGMCSNGAKADGTLCEEGDLCTGPDACQAGACKAGASVVCQPLDECHDAGKCFSGSGACSNPIKPNGTPCGGGMCVSGNCVPDTGTSSDSSAASGSGGAGGGAGSSGAGGELPGATSGNGGGTPGMNGGCGCRTAGEDEPAARALPVLALALMAAARRRRRTGG